MMVNGYLLMCVGAPFIFGCASFNFCFFFRFFFLLLRWWSIFSLQLILLLADGQALLFSLALGCATFFYYSRIVHFEWNRGICSSSMLRETYLAEADGIVANMCVWRVCIRSYPQVYDVSQRQRFSWVFMRWQLLVSVLSHFFFFFGSSQTFQSGKFVWNNLCAAAAAVVAVKHICSQSARSPAYTLVVFGWRIFIFSKKVFAATATAAVVVKCWLCLVCFVCLWRSRRALALIL